MQPYETVSLLSTVTKKTVILLDGRFLWPLGQKIPQRGWGNKKLIAGRKPPMIR